MVFNGNTFIVIEHTGLVRAGNIYDVYEKDGDKIGTVVEEVHGLVKKILKFTPLKTLLSFDIKFYDINNQLIVNLKRRFTFFLSKIYIYDEKGGLIGFFKQKFKLVIARFEIYSIDSKKIAVIIGDWKDWNFKIYDSSMKKIGVVNKKWAGLVKELFTTADKYIINVHDEISQSEKVLIIASAIIIDLVLKEYS